MMTFHKTKRTVKTLGLAAMVLCSIAILYSLWMLDRLSLNFVFWGLIGAVYYFADQLKKKPWAEWLLVLPALVGVLTIVLQDMGKLPVPTDLSSLTLIFYSCLLATALNKNKGESQ